MQQLGIRQLYMARPFWQRLLESDVLVTTATSQLISVDNRSSWKREFHFYFLKALWRDYHFRKGTILGIAAFAFLLCLQRSITSYQFHWLPQNHQERLLLWEVGVGGYLLLINNWNQFFLESICSVCLAVLFHRDSEVMATIVYFHKELLNWKFGAWCSEFNMRLGGK